MSLISIVERKKKYCRQPPTKIQYLVSINTINYVEKVPPGLGSLDDNVQFEKGVRVSTMNLKH